MRSMNCRICNNESRNKTHIVREMMFGLREEFEYLECKECGCLQIKSIPEDMSKYYPYRYYSFGEVTKSLKINRIKYYLRSRRSINTLQGYNICGRLLGLIKPAPLQLHWLKKCNATLESEILDVGCGHGSLLISFKIEGFKNLMGIDPYIEKTIQYPGGPTIYKNHISEIKGKHDVIIFHHSFEHMADSQDALKSAQKLLNKNGYIIIRMPTTSSFAWEHYGTNWVQIDAPRHFFIHSIKSIEILASKANLKIKEIEYDSTILQFWGSEQYMKDIPFIDDRSYCKNPEKSIFSKEEIEQFKLKTNQLNKEGMGDQFCLYLTTNACYI